MEQSSDRTGIINQGMQRAAQLPDIMPDQADEQVKPIYEDIKRTLRVPIVNLIFRTLANYPDYLEKVWVHTCPVFRTKAFEQAADDLRRNALLQGDAATPKQEWEQLDNLEKLRAFNDTIHYVLPKLLLVTTAFELATFPPEKEPSSPATPDENTDVFDMKVAKGTTKVEMVDPENASEQVKELFQSIKERHGHPLVSSYFRGLGNWPAFLEHTWSRLKPVVGTPEYEERKKDLIQAAEEKVKSFSFSALQDLKLSSQEAEDVRSILAAFKGKFIPEMLLDAAYIKAMLDSPEEALSSRFSVA